MPYADPRAQLLAEREGQRRYRARKKKGLTPAGANTGLTCLAEALLHPMEVEERRARLSQLARVDNPRLSSPISAIAELNKMDGSYAPEKHLVAGEIRFRFVYDEDTQCGDGPPVEPH